VFAQGAHVPAAEMLPYLENAFALLSSDQCDVLTAAAKREWDSVCSCVWYSFGDSAIAFSM
jgi:hypothetical protein